jgi:hypothetical protein
MVMVLKIEVLSIPMKLVGYHCNMECAYTTSAFPPLRPTAFEQCTAFNHWEVSTESPKEKIHIEIKSTKAASPEPEAFKDMYQNTNSVSNKNASCWKITPAYLDRAIGHWAYQVKKEEEEQINVVLFVTEN